MKPFLTAEWRRLILLTYAVEPYLLESYLPEGLTLDLYKDDRAFVSFVAFDFLNTKVKGIPIPFHVNFPEINLRFYVQHTDKSGEVRRGVMFIKELVPKHCIALVANKIYNEPYESTSMTSSFDIKNEEIMIEHQLTYKGTPHQFKIKVENKPYFPEENSTEHFFKEHSWGFGLNKKGQLTEYKVEHPVWKIYPLKERFQINIQFDQLYGSSWSVLNGQIPYNIMVAEGSPIQVFPGKLV